MPQAARTENVTPEEIAASRVLQRKLFDAGYAGISYPKEYGGRGLTAAHERAFREEAVGYVHARLRRRRCGHVRRRSAVRCWRTPPRSFCGRHVPKILSGDEIWCQFYSEPEAGSDLAGIRTQRGRDGDRWILNGSKIWSTGAYYADWAMCLARTDWDVPKHRGLTWFAVPTDAAGVTIRPIRQINGDAELLRGIPRRRGGHRRRRHR